MTDRGKTGKRDFPAPAALSLTTIGAAAADTLARAIGRAVYEAETITGHTGWRDTL